MNRLTKIDQDIEVSVPEYRSSSPYTKKNTHGASMTNGTGHHASEENAKDFLEEVRAASAMLDETRKKFQSLLQYRQKQQNESDRGEGDVDHREDIERLKKELGCLDAGLRDIRKADLSSDDVQSAWQLNDELESTLRSLSPSEMLFMPHADGTEFRPELIDEGPEAEIYHIKFPGRTDHDGNSRLK